ncbi:hypothetical protein [Sorangium sp. So ce1389]|uniref:hypothetical protein n=1 Tax=Sorangium sp. So ce1389 TaxID=3133336 RepID=UPI003F60CB49
MIMEEVHEKKPRASQANKPGHRALVVKIPEEDYRRFRVRATTLGLRNPEFLSRLLDLEAQQPIE